MRSVVFSSLIAGLKPNPYIMIDEYADRYVYLPHGSSAEPGKYSVDRMPYLRTPMQKLSPQNPTQQVKGVKGTQLGFTTMGMVVAFYYMYIAPTSVLFYLPSESLAKEFVSTKFTPALRAMPELASRITGGKTKDDIGTTFEKVYPGGKFRASWAGSPKNFRLVTAQVVIEDDLDGWDRDAGEEGGTADLGKKRADSFGIRKKIYLNSTPTTLDAAIWEEWLDSDQSLFFMPCPHCGEPVNFEWENFHFDYDRETYTLIGDTTFGCPHCGGVIHEHQKTEMMDAGDYVAQNPGHPHFGFRLPSYYSPVGFLSWNAITQEFLSARAAQKRGDMRKMKTWVNTRDARPWEEEIDTVNVEDLPGRKESYPAEVPDGVMVLTAGVDTQDDRFEIEVVGHGADEETWSIDYHIINGDPNLPETRDRLDEYLRRTFTTSDGGKMRIFSSAVDTGGHRTKAAYAFCKPRFSRRIYAIRGAKPVDAPFVTLRATRTNKAKMPLFIVGVNTGKDDIYAKLEITTPGAGYMHFPDKDVYNDEYFRQLTAEKRDPRTGRWGKYRHRNEAIDVRNYANAALYLANLDYEKLGVGHRIGLVSQSRPKPENKKKGDYNKKPKRSWMNGWK